MLGLFSRWENIALILNTKSDHFIFRPGSKSVETDGTYLHSYYSPFTEARMACTSVCIDNNIHERLPINY
jgi:hypothetical protein